MKRAQTVSAIAAGAVLMFLPVCGGDNGNGNGNNQVSSQGITLKWEMEGTLLNVTLSATTTGWVAAGFDPTSRMQNANIIIGYVASGTAHVRDDFGTGIASHASDESLGGVDNITNVGGSEVDGVTEINFTIPLDSGDGYDRVLQAGNTYTVLLAHGSDGSDEFSVYHAVRTSVEINL